MGCPGILRCDSVGEMAPISNQDRLQAAAVLVTFSSGKAITSPVTESHY